MISFFINGFEYVNCQLTKKKSMSTLITVGDKPRMPCTFPSSCLADHYFSPRHVQRNSNESSGLHPVERMLCKKFCVAAPWCRPRFCCLASLVFEVTHWTLHPIWFCLFYLLDILIHVTPMPRIFPDSLKAWAFLLLSQAAFQPWSICCLSLICCYLLLWRR